MGYYCYVCKAAISEKVYKYSLAHYGKALCMNHQKTVTPQAIKLSDALRARGIENIMEYDDGHKHVDIAILKAKMYLELDGAQHILNSKQLLSDVNRDTYSHKQGYVTIRIRNDYIDRHLNKVADSIEEVYQSRRKTGFLPFLTGLFKTGFKKISEFYYDLEEA